MVNNVILMTEAFPSKQVFFPCNSILTLGQRSPTAVSQAQCAPRSYKKKYFFNYMI